MNVKTKIKNKVDWVLWRIQNPSKPFHEFYIYKVKQRINKPFGHPTLGKTRTNDERFRETAQIEFDFLKKQGLNTESVFLDYGCGSLRLGRVLIPYLGKGNYNGLDMTDTFYMDGLEEIGQDIVDEKRPNLHVINDRTIRDLSQKNIDYIFSSAVLYHIPEDELLSYFEKISTLMSENTVAFVDFTDSPSFKHKSKLTWSYPASLILDKINTIGLKGTLLKIEREQDAKWYPEGHTILKLEKKRG